MNLFSRSFISLSGVLIAGLVLLMTGLALDRTPIVFESAESESFGNPVFNRVTWETRGGKDVWVMQQSHEGLNKEFQSWERVSIAVDLSKKVAVFRQHVSGEIDPQKTLHAKKQNYRSACYLCHSNGPRAIRPKWDSTFVQLNSWDTLRVTAWNLRMKLYGSIESAGDVAEWSENIRDVQSICRTSWSKPQPST